MDCRESVKELLLTYVSQEFQDHFDSQVPLVKMGFNSISYIDFIVSLENELDVEFPDDFLEELAY